jgi:hypothetical protein
MRVRRAFDLTPHSQTVTTCHPNRRSFISLAASRAMFTSIFFFQKARRVFGMRNFGQCSWPCQKQPWTKTTVRYFGSTMSGRPGRDRFFGPFTVNRYPSRWSIERTASSGFVSRLRMRDITRERFSGVKISAIGGDDRAIFDPRKWMGENGQICLQSLHFQIVPLTHF